MDYKNDWRLTNQINYLYKAKLIKTNYSVSSEAWDHDHCAFCWAKFDSDKVVGYCTTDKYHWICENCFNDFKDMFEWEVLNKA